MKLCTQSKDAQPNLMKCLTLQSMLSVCKNLQKHLQIHEAFKSTYKYMKLSSKLSVFISLDLLAFFTLLLLVVRN